MVEVINFRYEEAESCVAQGKEVGKARKRGFHEVKGGNGSYRMAKSSRSMLTYKVNGETKCENVRELICDHYGLSKISEKRAYQFYDGVKDGSIKLEYVNGSLKLG